MANPILPNEKSTRSLSEFEFLHDPSDKNSKLGVGSFASVKLAKEKKTGKQYAIKIINMEPSKLTNSDIHNIKTEISVHRKLDHQNIIKFHDYIQTPKEHRIFFVLDFAESGNLYSYIHKRKSLQPEEIFRFFYQTCLAVQYLHKNDILHRDLKPENLLLDKERNVKLCDFGWCAKRITEKRTTFCGTYEYMAPEIVYKKTYDYRVDVWSLGVLLYELIHREAPYKGRSLAEIAKSLTKPEIRFSSNCHPGAKDLVLKILKHNPEERISIAQILSHSWVQSHLPEDDSLQGEEDLSNQVKGNHESFKSNFVVSKNNELLEALSQPQTRKHSNVNLYSSSKENICNVPKEKEREKPKDRVKERVDMKDKQSNTASTSTTSIDVSRKSPFDVNLPLKTSDENTLTSRHVKSNSSASANILERPDFEERNKLNSNGSKKRVFDVSILSPTLKTKVDRILSHLSSQTTSHRMENVSGVINAKTEKRNSQAAQVPPTEVSLSNKYQSELRPALSNTSRNPSSLKIISTERADENSQSHILSSSRAKADLENIKATHHGEQIKGSFYKKLTLPRNDSLNNLSSIYGRNLTTRSKVGNKTPDTFEFEYKITGIETTKASSKNSINILSINDQNKYKHDSHDLLKRRPAIKTPEELHASVRQFSALSERRNENNKENKKDLSVGRVF